MEHRPIVMPPEHPPLEAMPPHAPRSSGEPTLWRWFGHLLETRPFAFWGGVWVSVFLIAIVAMGSLLSPSAAERRSVSAIALGSDSGVATQPVESRGKMPLWVFGAIAVSCTAGSIFVSRRLHSESTTAAIPPHPRRQRPRQTPLAPSSTQVPVWDPTFAPLPTAAMPPPQRPSNQRRAKSGMAPSGMKQPSKPKRGAATQRSQSHRHGNKPPSRPPQRLQPYSPDEPLLLGRHSTGPIAPTAPPAPIPGRPPTAQPPQSPPKTGVAHPTPSFVIAGKTGTTAPPSRANPPQFSPKPNTTQVNVTVVPEDQVHPLDWQQPRLADAVDLRKRKPLDSLL